jgi:hypothetical protein
VLRATLTITLIVLCSAIAFIAGRDQTHKPSGSLAVQQQQFDSGQAAGLDRRIPRLHLDNVPLDKSLIALADAAHLNMVISADSLSLDSHIQYGRTVSLDLKGATAGDALRAILPDGSWTLRGGVISIGGDRDEESRVYDIRDLAEDYVRYYYPPNDSSRGAPAPSDPAPPFHAAARAYARFLISGLGNPSGTSPSDISELAGRLIINATPEEHARIDAALRQLRAAHAKDPKVLLP